MLAILAGALLGFSLPVAASPRSESGLSSPVVQEITKLRTILPNGAVVFVQQADKLDRIVLQLFISSRSAPDTSKTEGYRHIWEHLVAKGRTKSLDAELEPQGAFLTAETYRDATVFQIVVKPGDLKLGLKAVQALTEFGELTADDVKQEAAIIRQEIALQEDSRILSRQAWKVAYGEAGLDPLGDPDVLAVTSPTALAHLHHTLMTGSNITLTIAGDIDLDIATSQAADVIGKMPGGTAIPSAPREYKGGGLTSAEGRGAALALPANSWNAPSTAARLSAALAIAASLKDSFVTYTPSLEGSLIVVGETGDNSALSPVVRKMNAEGMFRLGRILAHRWVSHEESVAQNGILTGLLLSEGAGQRTQTMHDNLDQMTVAAFTQAIQDFASKEAVEVIGK